MNKAEPFTDPQALPPCSSKPGSPEKWYRQFWPWLLIGLPGIVVIASFVTLAIAIKHADDTVADNYYKQGLAINQELSADVKARELGLRAHVELDATTLAITLEGNLQAMPTQLTARFIHPVSADRDFAAPLLPDSNGEYRARLAQPIDGRWTLEISQPAEAWRLRAQARIENGRSEFELIP